MPLEGAITGIQDLNPGWPTGAEFKNEGDNHIRNIKSAVQLSWPNMAGANTVGAELSALGFNAVGFRIKGCGNPTAASDAIPRSWLDAAIANLLANYLPFWVSFGQIDTDGSILEPGRGDFGCTRTALGKYRLVFDKFDDDGAQVLVATIRAADPGAVLCVQNVSVSQVDVFTETAGGSDADAQFNFIRAVIPTN